MIEKMAVKFWYCNFLLVFMGLPCEFAESVLQQLTLVAVCWPWASWEIISWSHSEHLLLNICFYHWMVLILNLKLDVVDLVEIFVVNELALLTVGTASRSQLVPLLAHLCFVVLVEALRRGFDHQLSVAVGIRALLVELANSSLHEVPAELRLVIDLEVFYLPEHLLSRLVIHWFLIPGFLAREVCVLALIP